MTLTNAHKKYCLRSFLEVIADIANEEFQKRIWICTEGPECADYSETMNHFADLGEPIIEDYEKFNVSKTQHNLLEELRDHLDAFSPKPHSQSEEFISSPEWQKIIKMAQRVMNAFHYQPFPGGFYVIITYEENNDNNNAQVSYKCKKWATISLESIRFFPPPDGICWEMPFDDAMETLRRAKKELLEFLEEVAKP